MIPALVEAAKNTNVVVAGNLIKEVKPKNSQYSQNAFKRARAHSSQKNNLLKSNLFLPKLVIASLLKLNKFSNFFL